MNKVLIAIIIVLVVVVAVVMWPKRETVVKQSTGKIVDTVNTLADWVNPELIKVTTLLVRTRDDNGNKNYFFPYLQPVVDSATKKQRVDSAGVPQFTRGFSPINYGAVIKDYEMNLDSFKFFK